MVTSIKWHLKKTIGGAKLIYEELTTIIAEVEIILNSRLLSYVSPSKVDEPLTPRQLLHKRRLLGLPDHRITGDLSDPDVELSHTSLGKTANHPSNVINHLWNRWKNEYMIELSDSDRHSGKSSNLTPIAVVVLHLLGFWRMARAEGLMTGADGLVRGATPTVKNCRSSILRCLIQLYVYLIDLYPLGFFRVNETNH